MGSGALALFLPEPELGAGGGGLNDTDLGCSIGATAGWSGCGGGLLGMGEVGAGAAGGGGFGIALDGAGASAAVGGVVELWASVFVVTFTATLVAAATAAGICCASL